MDSSCIVGPADTQVIRHAFGPVVASDLGPGAQDGCWTVRFPENIVNDPLIAAVRRRSGDPATATDQSDVVSRPVFPPTDAATLERAESLLGRRLPSLLRDLYKQVGDGGFGPGYGLLPLFAAPNDEARECVVDLYLAFRSIDHSDPAWRWPADLVPFCDWGCAIRSCIDCSSDAGAIVTFDPNVREPGAPMETALSLTHATLRSWCEDWVAGVSLWDAMFEADPEWATVSVNPMTKVPFTLVPTKLRR